MYKTQDLHRSAWQLFGKESCEQCGMSLKKHIKMFGCRFDMHNRIIPKDYSKLTPDAWICLCKLCHPKAEEIVRKYNIPDKKTLEKEMLMIYELKDLYEF